MDGTDGRARDCASPPHRDFRSSTQRPSHECSISDELMRSGHVDRYRHGVRDLHQLGHAGRLHYWSILRRRRAARDERIPRGCTIYDRGDVGGNHPGMLFSSLRPRHLFSVGRFRRNVLDSIRWKFIAEKITWEQRRLLDRSPLIERRADGLAFQPQTEELTSVSVRERKEERIK